MAAEKAAITSDDFLRVTDTGKTYGNGKSDLEEVIKEKLGGFTEKKLGGGV